MSINRTLVGSLYKIISSFILQLGY